MSETVTVTELQGPLYCTHTRHSSARTSPTDVTVPYFHTPADDISQPEAQIVLIRRPRCWRSYYTGRKNVSVIRISIPFSSNTKTCRQKRNFTLIYDWLNWNYNNFFVPFKLSLHRRKLKLFVLCSDTIFSKYIGASFEIILENTNKLNIMLTAYLMFVNKFLLQWWTLQMRDH